MKKTKIKTFKRADLITNNFVDLDNKKNLIRRKFVYKLLSQDFKFNKLQLKINNSIYDTSISLKKTKKKKWTK